MKISNVVAICLLTACTNTPLEAIGTDEFGLHTATITLQPLPPPSGVDILRNGGWDHIPSNVSLATILGDWNAADPNASVVGAGSPDPVGEDRLEFRPVGSISCNSIVSVQSVTGQFKIHTAGANEQPLFTFDPPTSPTSLDIPCGAQFPWRPVGTLMECGTNTNPATHALWTKQDIGCVVGSNFLIAGYKLGVNSAFVWEAMQLKITVTMLN